MSQVSTYINNRDTEGLEPISITQIYEYIKTGAWDNYVLPIRELKYGSPEYKKAKGTLPALTMSGVFPKGSRLNEALVEHSGRIVVDIDDLVDNVHDIKEALKLDTYTEAVFYSVGAKGLAVAVKIDGKKHVDSYVALEKYYKQKYGLKVDASCKNVARLRYVTSDPEIFINMSSEVFHIKQDEQFISDDYQPLPAYDPNKQGTHTVQDEIIRRSLALIDGAVKGGVHHAIMKAAFLAGGYIAGGLCDEQAVKDAMLMAILQKPNALSRKEEEKKVDDGIRAGKVEPCTELKVDESKSNQKRQFEFIKWYDLTPTEKTKHSNMIAEIRERHRAGDDISNKEMVLLCNNYGYDLNVYSLIKNEVWEKEKIFFAFDKKSEIQKMQLLVEDKYDVRYNVIMDRTEMYEGSKMLMVRDIKAEIYTGLKLHGHKIKLETLTQYLRSSLIKKYDPFVEYFKGLPEYDGHDYIKDLCNHVKTNDDDFFYEMVKKHLVRSVRCSQGIEENRFVIVLVSSKQDIGKSRFIRSLNPFGVHYFTEAGIKSGGQEKDTTIALTQNFIYNIDELENVFKKNKERFKSMVSSHIINERGSHRADSKMMVRRANFWASTNKTEFLEDDSNTRWLAFNVDFIDWGYSQAIDVHKVWSQAKYLHDSGYTLRLSKEEKEKQNRWNNTFEDISIEEHLIIKNFEKSGTEYVFVDEIIEHINNRTSLKIDITPAKVGVIMKKLGYGKSRKRRKGGKNPTSAYYCKPIDASFVPSTADENEPQQQRDPIPINRPAKLF